MNGDRQSYGGERMNDKELLELAAKAAGLSYIKPAEGYSGNFGLEVGSNPMRTTPWNPLSHDGDTFKLAVKLSISFEIKDGYAHAYSQDNDIEQWVKIVTEDDASKYAAVKQAVTFVAAEIGKRMEDEPQSN